MFSNLHFLNSLYFSYYFLMESQLDLNEKVKLLLYHHLASNFPIVLLPYEGTLHFVAPSSMLFSYILKITSALQGVKVCLYISHVVIPLQELLAARTF